MNRTPPWPDVDAEHIGKAQIQLRFDDVSQDGRVMLTTMPEALGAAIWRALLHHRPMTEQSIAQGIIPILTRLVIDGGQGPVSVETPVDARGTFELAHTVDASGAVERILLRMWAELAAPIGRTYGAQPEGAGAPVRVGSVFADHVLTRLFAPPGERRVTRLSLPGIPEVPVARADFPSFESILEPPEGAKALCTPVFDDAVIVFGVGHTDANMHVNSLAYPWMFEEAALRLLSRLGRSTANAMPRRLEIAWRKPCFAGDSVQWRLEAFDAPGGLCVSGALHAAQDHSGRPHCYLNMCF